MRRIRLFSVLACVAVMVAAAPANAVSIFLGDTTSPSHDETYEIDTSSVGSFQLGIWVVPDTGQTLNGVDLNLRVEDTSGTGAIDLTGATVHNPVSGVTEQRWFDVIGTGVDSVTADLITGMIGATTIGTGHLDEGLGMDDTNSGSETGTGAAVDLGGGTWAYLFATVDYNVTVANDEANLWLQISDAGIGVENLLKPLDESVIFGDNDGDLNSSVLAQRNDDQTGSGQDIEDAEASGGVVVPLVGDADRDDSVTGLDYLEVQQKFGNVGLPNDPLNFGDADNDGSVTGLDYLSVQQNFGKTRPPFGSASASAVPEPSTMVMLLMGLIAVGLRRRS